jgi:hypothetical protein
MRVGRGFGGVVVAHQRQHAAVLRRAGEVGVAEHVAGAVDARSLAVPDGEDAVMLALAEQFRLLRAPAGGRGEFLVEARAGRRHRRRAAPWPSRAAGRARRAASRDSPRRSRPCSARPAGRARAASAACAPRPARRRGRCAPCRDRICRQRDVVKRHRSSDEVMVVSMVWRSAPAASSMRIVTA